MTSQSIVSEFYLTVLPVINVSSGSADQILTLTPDKSSARKFFPDEVDLYIDSFKKRMKHFVGGHVTAYVLNKENAVGGLFIVKVTQHVG
jgi:hypothetical protein